MPPVSESVDKRLLAKAIGFDDSDARGVVRYRSLTKCGGDQKPFLLLFKPIRESIVFL